MPDPFPNPPEADSPDRDRTVIPDHFDQTETGNPRSPDASDSKSDASDDKRFDGSEGLQLMALQLEQIRRYQRDALKRENPLEAVIASANADHLEMRLFVLQGLKAPLAAEAFSLEVFQEYQLLMKEFRNLTNQIHQLSQLELKIHRTSQRDPFVRWGPSAPR